MLVGGIMLGMGASIMRGSSFMGRASNSIMEGSSIIRISSRIVSNSIMGGSNSIMGVEVGVGMIRMLRLRSKLRSICPKC